MTDDGRKFLTDLGADFLEGTDLRLMLEESKFPEYKDWFLAGEGREHGPLREIIEELTLEHPVFDKLSADDFTLEVLGTYEKRKATDRPGFEGELTLSIQEFYRLTFTSEAEAIVKSYCATHGNDGIVLVTDEERLAKSLLVQGEAASCRDLEDFMSLE